MASFSVASTIAAVDEFVSFGDAIGEGETVAVLRERAASGGLNDDFIILSLWVGLAAGAVTIWWWWRAHRAAAAAGLPGMRWSSGWAVGGWFIPVANLVIEKLVLNEIDRISQDREDVGWRRRRLTPLLNWWWAAWVLGLVAGAASAVMAAVPAEASSFDPNAYRAGLGVAAVAAGLSVVGALLGAASVGVIGDRFRGD